MISGDQLLETCESLKLIQIIKNKNESSQLNLNWWRTQYPYNFLMGWGGWNMTIINLWPAIGEFITLSEDCSYFSQVSLTSPSTLPPPFPQRWIRCCTHKAKNLSGRRLNYQVTYCLFPSWTNLCKVMWTKKGKLLWSHYLSVVVCFWGIKTLAAFLLRSSVVN